MTFFKFSVNNNYLMFLPILFTHVIFHRGLAGCTFMLNILISESLSTRMQVFPLQPFYAVI